MRVTNKKKLAKNVEGFLTDREGQLLYHLANHCTGKGIVVEIGSWKGKSTVWIAQGLTDAGLKGPLVAIDPHIGSEEHQQPGKKIWTFEAFENNIEKAGFTSIVKPIIRTSAEARQEVNSPIEFLFIDGAHDYDNVKQDFDLYFPLVIEGGFIAFHDSQWDGVDQFIQEALKRNILCKPYFTDSLFVVQKTSKSTVFDQMKNQWMIRLNQRFHACCAAKGSKFIRSTTKGLVKFARDIVAV